MGFSLEESSTLNYQDMNLTPFLPVAAALVLAAPVAAYGQFGAYATLTLDQIGNTASSPVRNPAFSYNNSVNPLGGTFGAYYDFRNLGPVRLGVDARGVVAHDSRGAQATSIGPGTRIDSGLLGARASFHSPIALLKPYAQLSAGIGRSNYGILSNSALVTTSNLSQSGVVLRSNFEYHVYAGVDLKVLPFFDFRVVELGYGGLDPFGTYSHNYPLRSVTTGAVFHFPTLP